MNLSELKALWAQWIKIHGTPAKGSQERYVAFAMRDIDFYLDGCQTNEDLTLEMVSNLPNLGRKRIKYVEDVLGIKFTRKVTPMKQAGSKEAVYVLLEKFLDTEEVRVAGVYSTGTLAEEAMNEYMYIFEELRSYKIESKTLA